MPKYKRGDVVYAWFPFEDKIGSKKRPTVIIGFNEETGLYSGCKVTKTDVAYLHSGRFVKFLTRDANIMKLAYSSFVDYERIEMFTESDIERPMGNYPYLNELPS